ncbi:O-antigen ligase family protein [Desulfobacula sp.]|uniref:O-antigen ligase family protein n=1 Tax=Desulfobacula sp. TaxID=2593537 RepID=UPI0026016DD6|nr:O-antigen ligase family protein [Desulfobacula sp.]
MQNLWRRLSALKSDDLMYYCVVLTFFLLPTGTAPPLIAIGLAALVWLVSGKVCHIKTILRQSWFFPLIPILVLPWIGLLYSQNTDLGLDYAMKTKYWIAVFITAGLVLDENRVYLLLKWFWAGLFLGACLALLQYTGMMAPIEEKHLGFGIVHTFISMYLIIGILSVSFYFKRETAWNKKFILLFLMLAFLFHLAVLEGRSGYLIFGILSPLVANNLMHRFSWKIKITVSILLICALLLSPVVRKIVNNTVINLKDQKEKILSGEDVVQFPRAFILRESIHIFMSHPFIGIGTGSITEPTKAKGHRVDHPHNNLLYMATSFGIFGIAAYLWFLWKMFKLSWTSRETATGYFVFSTCSVLFLSGMFDTQILNTETLLFLSVSYGFLNHLDPDNRKEV